MKKSFLVLLLILFTFCPCYAWGKKAKPLLYFGISQEEIEKNLIEKNKQQNIFHIGEKIYFLAYTPEGFKSDYIKYQLVKQADEAHVGGYSRVRNVTCRIRNKNYYSDYFILYEAGKYYLQVFDIQNLHQWVVIGEFRVVE